MASVTRNALLNSAYSFSKIPSIYLRSYPSSVSPVSFTTASKFSEGRNSTEQSWEGVGGDKAGEAAGNVKEKANDKAYEMKESTKVKAKEEGNKTAQTVQNMGEKAKQTVQGAWEAAKDTTQRVKESLVWQDDEGVKTMEERVDGRIEELRRRRSDPDEFRK